MSKTKKINARAKGCGYERKLMGELREWFPDIKTSRFASKMMDDAGVDFVNTNFFSLQAKAVEKGMNGHLVLEKMPDDDNINVILHKKNRQGEIAIMSKKDFYAILEYFHKFGLIT